MVNKLVELKTTRVAEISVTDDESDVG